MMNAIGIFTTDLEKTVLFYRDVMGFETSWDFKSKDVLLTQGNRKLILYPREDFEDMVSKKLSYSKATNGTFEISFGVNTFKKVDEKYNEVIKKGAKSVLPPTTEPWGQRTCYVEDPDGNLIEISSFFNSVDILTTDRLILKPFSTSDVDDVFDYSKDEETTRYLSWDVHTSKDRSLEAIETYLMDEAKYAITLKSTNKVIGCIDIMFTDDDNRVEFGYVLNNAYWNQGYMSESLSRIIKHCFEEQKCIDEIEGLLFIENRASARVMEKCGMKWSKSVKNLNKDGKIIEMDHYIITKEEYNKSKC